MKWIERAARNGLRRPKRFVVGAFSYLYDFNRFRAASSALGKTRSARSLSALIIKEYHRLEKGMALPSPRPGFGQDAARRIMSLVAEHERRFGPCHAVREARGCLDAYLETPELDPALSLDIDRFLDTPERPNLPRAGTLEMTQDQVRRSVDFDFEAFFATRRSVRQFTGEGVERSSVETSVRIAMGSPRVCNRGATRVYAIYDDQQRARALAHQNGNAGFGDTAGAVLIITTNMAAYTDFGERNQAWIDGGLFAMTLAYALHAQSLGTCFLNWSATPGQDKAMRKDLGIPPEEAVITFMAVGKLRDVYSVAASPREPFAQAYKELG